MESFEDSNCHSMSDSFSLYERYMRSFNVVNKFVEHSGRREPCEPEAFTNCDSDSSNTTGNIELSTVHSNVLYKHCGAADTESSLLRCDLNIVDKGSSTDLDLSAKIDSPCTPLVASLLEYSSTTVDRSDHLVSSEESKFDGFKHPVFITPTMENSSNAVDSVPMFREVGPSETVFKLPISELSFNGTLKHVQKLKPIVDPITALSASTGLVTIEDKIYENCVGPDKCDENIEYVDEKICGEIQTSCMSDNVSCPADKASESIGDCQSDESSSKKQQFANDDGSVAKWNPDQSYSSLEASFDSGVRSPDMFSEEEEDDDDTAEPFWHFLNEYEAHDKRKVRKIEETLQGVLPPPSVTILKTDVNEMLKKYYCHLPLFNEEAKVNLIEKNSMTPTKRVSFVEIPEKTGEINKSEDLVESSTCLNVVKPKCENTSTELDTSANDKSIHLKMCTEIEATETVWPDVMKCRHYDVHYNVTRNSEKFELLLLRYGERYVGAETDTSVNIYSGGMQSPNSASKRKALKLKMAQAKSPGRRLSHLARRRQAFCSAATIGEKAHASSTKMVLIDKKKLINSSERKSPRTRRTPGKKTPTRKTPGKKTPAKTPKTRSGGSSKKKAMRRLLMDSENITRSQPSRETLKRALFISPEQRKPMPQASSTSVPVQAMKSRRALFGSPVNTAETKSMDGTQSDQFLKRKRDPFDDVLESRSKIAKSLSFGGDSLSSSQSLSFSRRASEVFATKTSADLNETQKKKLIWAVSEALRVHGWRMSSPGFREKATALCRLTRRLLALPHNVAKLAAPQLSTSDTMLKVARQYVFAIIQGRTVDECYQEEQIKLVNEATNKVTGYISVQAYQQMRARQVTSTFTSQIKENSCMSLIKQEQSKSTSKNILQDKLVNIDSNSNSSSGLSMLDKSSLGLFKSNSMPSFEETAKMRARRQISFDNVDFPKR